MHLKSLFSALLLMLIAMGGFASDSRNPYSINVSVTTWAELQNALSASGTVTLNNDITVPTNGTTLTIPEGKTVTLNLNNHTLTGKSDDVVLTVEGDLTIKDSGTWGLITGATIGVYVKYEGSCTMESGRISNNKYGVSSSGTFEMKNGSVINNKDYNLSGNIYIYDGLIGGVESEVGIWLDLNNDCIMYGGTITNTKSCAVDMNVSSKFNMYGGSIKDNQGFGIRSKGIVSISKPYDGDDAVLIKGNAKGGIYNIGEYAKCFVTGGTISGNNEFGVKSETAVICVGGSAVIKDNDDDNIILGDKGELCLCYKMTDKADIRVTVPSNGVIKLNQEYVTSTHKNLNVEAGKIHNNDGTLSGTIENGNIVFKKPIKVTSFSKSKEYTGKPIVPDVVVTDGSKTLVEGIDYTFDYSVEFGVLKEIIDIGDDYIVSVVGQGDYAGSEIFNFEVTKATATITTAPEAIEGLKYNGKAQVLIKEGVASAGDLVYCLNGYGSYTTTLPTATDAGEYVVYYRVNSNANLTGTSAKTVKVSIAKAENQFTTIPQAIENLVYNAKEHVLISEPQALDGTITYTMGGKDYTKIPTATNAGTYTIKCQVAATTNYNATSKEVTVTIAKAANKIAEAPSAVNKLIEDGTEHNLVWQGEALYGTILYSLDGKNYTASIPTAVDAGDYTIYYKVEGTDNYEAIEPASIKVTVAEKEALKPTKQAYALLNGETLTFYYGEEKPKSAKPIRTSSDDSNWPVSLCRTITNVVFDQSFKEYKPFKTSSWFRDCDNLTEVSGMENINTEELEYMDEMFQFCNNLKYVDFTGFNTAKVTDMTRVFWGCENLAYVLVDENWNTTSVKKSSGMFEDCYKLYGGKGTAYNADITDVTYARIDGGTETPGYLTKSGDPAFKKTIVSITVSTSPITDFTQDEDFSADNGKLTLTYNTGDKETINLSEATITGYDKTKVGEQTLKVVYQGVETTLTVTVKAKEQNNNNGNNDNPPTPVSSVDNTPSVKVWSFNSTIYIETAPDTKYTIIDLNGRILKSSTTSSSKEEIRLNQSGIVVVIINGASYKLAL